MNTPRKFLVEKASSYPVTASTGIVPIRAGKTGNKAEKKSAAV